jgi:hypothetical protein
MVSFLKISFFAARSLKALPVALATTFSYPQSDIFLALRQTKQDKTDSSNLVNLDERDRPGFPIPDSLLV